MKKVFIAAISIIAVLAGCAQHRTAADRLMDNYALVTLPAPDLSGITDNGKEVLNLYRFASDEADRIYWEQNFGDKDALISSIRDEQLKQYALVNYGPWDRIDGKSFVPGYGAKPAGANFYPADMSLEEFEAFDNPDKSSPYTLIARDENGSLKTVWYHDAYSAHIEKICSYLTAAADLTIKPSVRNYLLKKVDALRTDNYYESEKAWLEMTDSKMDLVLGPNETVDDGLYGIKASYGAYVLLKNLQRTEELNALSARLPEFQQMLPGDPAYRDFVPGTESDIFSCNVLYYGGYTNAGFKVIAVNFPYDATLQKEVGTRTILFDNIIREKFNRTVFPVGSTLLEGEHQSHVDASAFYWIIVFREMAKGLGVKETVNGKGSVAEALGAEALTFEKAKSNVLGAWLCGKEASAHRLGGLVQKEDVLVTFIVNTIRSCRFGDADATGRANLLTYNYLLEKGAFHRNEDGRYSIDSAASWKAIEELGALILKTQATGDSAFAREFISKYAIIPANILADITSLKLEAIPVDIRVNFER